MPYPRGYRPPPPPPNTHYERQGGNYLPTLVFPSAKDDHLVGEYSRDIVWYSGPCMLTKGLFQPREPTAKEVDDLQAHANMMFFYKGRENIVLNTDPVFHKKGVLPIGIRHRDAQTVRVPPGRVAPLALQRHTARE